jgi:hypothetical protein
MMRNRARLVCLLLVLSVVVWADAGFRVLHRYPHDPTAYTQGLIFEDGHLYESTGLYGHSTQREVDLETGRAIREHELPSQYFGEGLTNWKDTLVQITWKEHTGFVYDRATFRLIRTFHYSGEGWGLTQDGRNLNSQRWYVHPPLSQSRDFSATPEFGRDRPRQGCSADQRTGIRPRRNLRKHLVLEQNCAYIS